MRLRADVQTNVIVRGFDPLNVVDFQKQDASRILNCNALRVCRACGESAHLLFRAYESALESRVVERLENVVERTRFEGSQRVLIVCGNKDDCARHLAAD